MSSILNQTYQHFEVIILDDKSTDNSIEIIDKYRNNHHVSHVVVNDENSGRPCRQWHKGICLAKGELIWIAESDDSCSSIFLEKLVAFHCSNDVILTFSRTQRINEKGKLSFTFNFGFTEGTLDGKEFIKKYLGSRCVIVNASSVIFEKKVFQNVPDDYLEYQGSADWLFWIEMCRQGKIAFVDEPLNYMRYHNSNTTVKNGLNDFMDSKINNYLFSQGLISKHLYKQNIRNRINELSSFRQFDSELQKKELLRAWGGIKFRM